MSTLRSSATVFVDCCAIVSNLLRSAFVVGAIFFSTLDSKIVFRLIRLVDGVMAAFCVPILPEPGGSFTCGFSRNR